MMGEGVDRSEGRKREGNKWQQLERGEKSCKRKYARQEGVSGPDGAGICGGSYTLGVRPVGGKKLEKIPVGRRGKNISQPRRETRAREKRRTRRLKQEKNFVVKILGGNGVGKGFRSKKDDDGRTRKPPRKRENPEDRRGWLLLRKEQEKLRVIV